MANYKPTIPMKGPLDTWYFEDLTREFRKAIEFAYTLRRKWVKKDIPYNGPSITALSLLCGSPGVEETLEAEWLRMSNDDQGIDTLQSIIGCILRVGIEQGFRMVAKDHMIQTYVRDIRRHLDGTLPDREWAMDALDRLEENLKRPGGIGYTLEEYKDAKV